MDKGFGINSLGSYPIMKALRDPDVARVLIVLETYNATILNRASNAYARLLANRLGIAQTGGSDAQVVKAIGLGTTEYPGHTCEDLLIALHRGLSIPRKSEEWSNGRILGSWAVNYLACVISRPPRSVISNLEGRKRLEPSYKKADEGLSTEVF